MNEKALEKILRRLRGPSWTGPIWVPSRRASRYDVRTQDSVSSNLAIEDKDDSPEKNAETASESARPFIDASGNLIIPTLGAEKYHWWKNGQTVLETLTELGASDETMIRYREPSEKLNSR